MWTGPVILTLCISGLAFVLSLISLVWQIISWRRSGPRVKVVRIQGVGGPPSGAWSIGVEARNSGRLGTKVQQFGFELPDRRIVTSIYDFIDQVIEIPIDLPAGGTASVMYSAQHIHETLAGHRFGKKVRPFAVTGHGRFKGKKIDLATDVDLLCRRGPSTRRLDVGDRSSS